MVASVVSAQDVDVDTFETYADTTALLTEWAIRSYTEPTLQTSGGADGTAKWMRLHRAGYTMGVDAADLGTPTAGSYKVAFYYMNGQENSPWENLTVEVKQGTEIRATINVGSTVQSSWTYAESGVVSFTAEPITVAVIGDFINAAAGYTCAVDEIKLLSAALPVTVTATPDDTVHITKTTNIAADVEGGSGSYTSVTFDVGADGSIEGTDTSAPYEFSWNTLTVMPQDTSGTVQLRIIATDSLSSTGQYIGSYVVDNRGSGFDSLVTNGDFSGAWTGTGNQIPEGWAEFSTDGAITYWGPADVSEQLAGQGACLKLTCAGGLPGEEVGIQRYKIRSNAVYGLFSNLQAACYAKGSFTSLYYFTSLGGATWTKTPTAAVTVNSTTWSYAIGPIHHYLADGGPNHIVVIAPHVYTAGDYFYDAITAEGILLEGGVPTAVQDEWQLYP
jgi:hypothetical protein